MKEKIFEVFEKLGSGESFSIDEFILLIVVFILQAAVTLIVVFILLKIIVSIGCLFGQKHIKQLRLKIISAIIKGKEGVAFDGNTFILWSSVLSRVERILLNLFGFKKYSDKSGSNYSFFIHEGFCPAVVSANNFSLYGLPVVVTEVFYSCEDVYFSIRIKAKLNEKIQEASYDSIKYARLHDGLYFFNKKGGRLVWRGIEKEPADKVRRYQVLIDKDDYKLKVW